MNNQLLKIKKMTPDEMLLAIDRLTRFKFPEIKYNRVFKDILSKHLSTPQISHKIYETLSEKEICYLIEEVFKYSLADYDLHQAHSYNIFKIINTLENNLYTIDNSTKELMQAKIPYESILELNNNTLCKNLQFLKALTKSKKPANIIRKNFSTKFPIEKIIITEGITEEILLPKFSEILNYDFNKFGVEIIAAGGKNQVAKDYLNLRDRIKVPIAVLLDADAQSTAEKISKKLRPFDKLLLIKKGEFEDILPLKLIKNAINYKFVNLFTVKDSDFEQNICRVKALEEIYRINGLGEFKKAEFAQDISTVLNKTDSTLISEDIKLIINELKTL